jgi:membrane protein
MTAEKETSEQSKLAAARERVDALKEKVDEVATREREKRMSVRAAYRLVESDRRTGGSLIAGGLAYRVFLFFLPYALFVSSFARTFGRDTTTELLGDAGIGSGVAETVDQAARSTGRAAPVLMVMSFALMLWTAQSTWKALRISSELAWGIRSKRSYNQLRVALITTGSLVGLSAYHFLLHPLYAGGPALDLVTTAVAATGLCVLAVLGMSTLPRPDEVEWLNLLPGAVLFGVGFELLRFFAAFFLSDKLDRTVDLYGALGIAAVIMGFLYLVGRLIVATLFVNAEWWRTQTGTTRPDDQVITP